MVAKDIINDVMNLDTFLAILKSIDAWLSEKSLILLKVIINNPLLCILFGAIMVCILYDFFKKIFRILKSEEEN